MIEIRGDKKVLITPISAEDLADIKIGDIVWLDGDLMTCRDVAHRRLVEYGRELPYDIRNKAIFHAGPIVRKIEGTENDYEMVSVGPTTSMRMEKFEYEFTKETGVRVIVAKGGMGYCSGVGIWSFLFFFDMFCFAFLQAFLKHYYSFYHGQKSPSIQQKEPTH